MSVRRFLRHSSVFSSAGSYYTITTTTGSEFNMGTESHVFIRLFGDKGSTELLPLKTKGATNFQPGQ